jgi:hypothetical protein
MRQRRVGTVPQRRLKDIAIACSMRPSRIEMVGRAFLDARL